ncbi:hypothetical protein KLP28_07150 [Nocardioidaceae bacterium]|nr:hypothetical protein KLP28_07150 [Nocardioidaceae bacterium]
MAAGEVPAALRVLDEDSEPVLRTTPDCRAGALRTVEVPVRRNGLLRLRATARVVATLAARVGDQAAAAGPRDVGVLAPRTDLAVLLVRDAEGAVLARTSAEQIDERWFVDEVEVCQPRNSDS